MAVSIIGLSLGSFLIAFNSPFTSTTSKISKNKSTSCFTFSSGQKNLLSNFSPEVIYTYLQPFFYDKYLESLNYQFQRQRYFPEIFDEILIPLLFYILYSQKSRIKRVILIFSISGIASFSLLSNWRIRLIIFILSFFISLKVYAGISKNLTKVIFISVILFMTFSYIISVQVIGFNALDRLLLQKKEDITNITGRFKNFNTATSLALSFPIFGVGLGQYEEYIPEISKLPFLNTFRTSIRNLEIAYYPHSIFFSTLATSGFLGLFSFTLLILYFLKRDLSNLKRSSLLYKSFLIVFWTMFIYSNSTPTNYFSYQAMFWFFRAIIEKLT